MTQTTYPEGLVTRPQAAEILGVTVSCVNYYRKTGKLPRTKKNSVNRVRIPLEDVLKLKASKEDFREVNKAS